MPTYAYRFEVGLADQEFDAHITALAAEGWEVYQTAAAYNSDATATEFALTLRRPVRVAPAPSPARAAAGEPLVVGVEHDDLASAPACPPEFAHRVRSAIEGAYPGAEVRFRWVWPTGRGPTVTVQGGGSAPARDLVAAGVRLLLRELGPDGAPGPAAPGPDGIVAPQ